MTTIETIARDHYLPEKRARRRATTVEGYESSIRLHVLPAFGSMEIAEITRGAARPETLWNSFGESRVVVLTGIGELHVPEHNHNVASSSQTQHLVFRVRHFPKRRRLGYGMLRGGVCCRSVCEPVSWRIDSRHVLNRNIAVCLDHETSSSDRLR